MSRDKETHNREDRARKILVGSVDFHIHAGPDAFRQRFCDADEVARQAKLHGMKGIVLKSHDYGTAPLARLIMHETPGLFVGGSIVLNPGIGGINPAAVDVAGRLGAKVVWMPTLHSVAERRRSGFMDGVRILDDRGKLLPQVKEVLSLVRQYDMALGTGHLTGEEIQVLFKESREMCIDKFVATHVMKIAGSSLSLEIQKYLAKQGAFIEYSFAHTLPLTGGIDAREMVSAIKDVGVTSCILSTDLGQLGNPSPCDGLYAAIARMLECGLSEEDVRIVVQQNPSRLLNLE